MYPVCDSCILNNGATVGVVRPGLKGPGGGTLSSTNGAQPGFARIPMEWKLDRRWMNKRQPRGWWWWQLAGRPFMRLTMDWLTPEPMSSLGSLNVCRERGTVGAE